MPEPQALHGGCLCGKVRYTVTVTHPGETLKPLCNFICHCNNCKKATGTHMANPSMFKREQLTVTSGTPAIFEDKNTDSGNAVLRRFCRDCGSPLYLTSTAVESIVAVSSGSLDDGSEWWTPNSGKSYMNGAHYLGIEDTVLVNNNLLQSYTSSQSRTGFLNYLFPRRKALPNKIQEVLGSNFQASDYNHPWTRSTNRSYEDSSVSGYVGVVSQRIREAYRYLWEGIGAF